MEIVETINEVREHLARARLRGRVGLVPTMGALHAGHASLIEAARRACHTVAVSIFVNPTQFGPNEDFDRYPRDLRADADLCERLGVDLIFAPSTREMYPRVNRTWVDVEKLSEPLCGARRPGHFRGVATVCAKLFNIVQPDAAYFGQKDAQQAILIRRMVADLNLPLEIVVCPIVREPDGLAISSRNQYLDAVQRQEATRLYQALSAARRRFAEGVRETAALIAAMREVLSQSPTIRVEYVDIVDAETLEPVASIERPALAALAAHVGSTRLIDNTILDLNDPTASV